MSLQYLAAQYRAQIDWQHRSEERASREPHQGMRGRYRRQAEQHARRAAALAAQMISTVVGQS